MNASRSRLLVLALVSAPLLVIACNPAGGGDTHAASLGEPQRDIQDLITALTPPPPTSIPVVKNDWFVTRKRTLERLREADEAHGLEALRVLREAPPALAEVRSGLLDIAAHTAPQVSEELLVKLTTTFGEDLGVRKNACELLGACCPLKAIEVLEPILRERYDDRTYPPEERMLSAWLAANKKLELDPTPLLALVATDLHRPQDVRHLATRALGLRDSPLARQALQTLLVESSGNGYIRRLALQSLRDILPKEEFCALAKSIQDKEADPQMIDVLEKHLEASCR